MIHNYNSSPSMAEGLSQLLLLTSLMGEDMQRGLAAYGLTQARAQVIWEVGSSSRLTQRDLAERLDVTPRNVTALIDALEETGFVARTAHATDRRATVVVLTEKGLATARKLKEDMTAFAHALFDDIPAEDYQVFLRVLGKATNRMTQLKLSRK